MLETVRIRQSGYSVRLTFEEFIQHYRILLPKGLLSSRNDIKEFLERMNLNQDNYQMGKTKVFMRESKFDLFISFFISFFLNIFFFFFF